MEIGHIIASLRHEQRVSQKNLAQEINVSTTVVALWETDNRTPSYENICALADYFHISTDVLCEKDRKLSPSEYQKSVIPDEAQKILDTFLRLNEDNRDILIGKAKELLKTQHDGIEKNVDIPLRKTAT